MTSLEETIWQGTSKKKLINQAIQQNEENQDLCIFSELQPPTNHK